jgi:predicted O-methyltransferase YrrM
VPEIRPLEKLPVATSANEMCLADMISQLPEMPGFEQTRQYFEDYPPLSSLGDPGVYRAMLYQIVRLTRPKFVLEIGSLFAGTTEVIARALWANGEGKLTTVDPYGGNRVPVILSQWPSELRQHVRFIPVSSAILFMDFLEEHQKIDLAFIDGNHDYEFVYFDLLSVARRIAPSGIVVLDNATISGVFFAVKTFLNLFPAWSVMEHRSFQSQLAQLSDEDILSMTAPGKSLSLDLSAEPRNTSLSAIIRESVISPKLLLSSLERADAFILVAPPHLTVGTVPVVFRSGRVIGGLFEGFQLELSRPAASGWLTYSCQYYLWPPDYLLTGHGHRCDADVGKWEVKEGALRITVELPRALGFANAPDGHECSWEMGLAFVGNASAQFLSLAEEPIGILSD